MIRQDGGNSVTEGAGGGQSGDNQPRRQKILGIYDPAEGLRGREEEGATVEQKASDLQVA